ncbi:hypothetical protein [Paenibacillus abyssi]|uniref:Uncharacterized protein n=1 Tax=Paenibacillus abyssi TaxID=1340531 RepID=A0A917FP02_9BACL|nr:hypothetical protein [Paenibacillus abyssi]GGF95107.1 hypothetical protein GCM10010916_10630 [Paenibacillus abyssi]
MRVVNKHQLEARVEAVIEIIQEVTGKETVSNAIKSRLNSMSYEELGILAMNIVKTRSIEEILGVNEENMPGV